MGKILRKREASLNARIKAYAEACKNSKTSGREYTRPGSMTK